MLKVAIFTGSDVRNYGGGEKDAIKTANCLPDDYDIDLYSLNEQQSNLLRVSIADVRRDLNKNISIIFYHGRKLRLLKDIWTNINLYSDLEKYDVIYSYCGGWFLNRKIAKRAKRLIVGVHTQATLDNKPIEDHKMWKRLSFRIVSYFHHNFLRNRVHEIRIQNSTDRERLEDIRFPGKVWNVPSLTFSDIHTPLSDDGFNVVWINRIQEEKRPEEIEKILHYLNPGIKFYVIGGGKESIRQHLENLHKTDYPNLEILGFLSEEDLLKRMQNAMAYISTSRGENYGMSAIEAQGCGVPTVVYNVMGLRDYNKYIVNNAEEAARKINDLYDEFRSDPNTYMRERIKIAKKAYAQFSDSVVVPQLRRMFASGDL